MSLYSWPPQPHHYYGFHTSILFANKKIYQEAAYILYHENLFVLVSINDERVSTSKGLLSGFIEYCGVPVVARKRQAREFQHHAMELYISHSIDENTVSPRSFNASADQEQKSIVRTDVIVAGDDLNLLSKSYIKYCPDTDEMVYEMYLQKSFIRLGVLIENSQPPSATLRSVCKPATYERRLLEPFRRLHSHTSVQINGAISAEYKSEILCEMAKAPQIADDLLYSMTIARCQAEEQFSHGKLELACKTYQTVIEDVEMGFEWPPKSGRPFRCYRPFRFHDERTSWCDNAICHAELNARNRLSEICLALQRPDQVRKWADSAILTLHIHRNFNDRDGMRMLRAKQFYWLARASHQMDVRCNAIKEIEWAVSFDPTNEIYTQMHKDWLVEEAQQPHEHKSYPEACTRRYFQMA